MCIFSYELKTSKICLGCLKKVYKFFFVISLVFHIMIGSGYMVMYTMVARKQEGVGKGYNIVSQTLKNLSEEKCTLYKGT